MIEKLAENRFVLTPGRYVGTEEAEDDGDPIEEKIARLKGELFAAFVESDQLQKRVRTALDHLNG
jgi:type I restriction enzyme M protein